MRTLSQLANVPTSAFFLYFVVDSIFRSANFDFVSAEAIQSYISCLSLSFHERCLWWKMVARQHVSSRKSTPAAVHHQRHPTTMFQFWALDRAVKNRWVAHWVTQTCSFHDWIIMNLDGLQVRLWYFDKFWAAVAWVTRSSVLQLHDIGHRWIWQWLEYSGHCEGRIAKVRTNF